jgi:Domain of unknown function (DUF4123)
MDAGPETARLYKALWTEGVLGSEKLFGVLDGARSTKVFAAVDGSHQDKYCLYSGQKRWPGDDLSWNLIGIAPYLVELEKTDDLTHYLLRHGWGEHWGIFCRSEASITTLRTHFRGLLLVRTELDRKLLFRFYDPRVLRHYLPSCTASELRAVFGPVTAFILPGTGSGTATQFRFDGSSLLQEQQLARPQAAPAARSSRSSTVL